MFLERDGTPIVGQVPMEVRYSGGGNYSTVAADVGALVRAFVNNVRQSLVPTHCETLPLPGNGFVELRYEYGSMMVDVYLPPAPDEGGPFYGGILINPHVITGDEAAYLSLAGNPTPWRVPDQVKSAGEMPGRPAVPGTGDAETEWLVVQISRDLPLTGSPLDTGAVRMFRIDSPLFGAFCEVAEPGRYAVSTIDGSAFFMCGRQLDYVPPMPAELLPSIGRSIEAGGGISPSRIRTIGMQPASFIEAHAAEGIIIFALVNQLWALNTRERTDSTPAPWRLLAEAAMPRAYPGDYLPNEFGAQFTVTTGEDTTITCSGTNAVGECSGWTVTVTPGVPLPELAGTISLVDSGFRASVAHSQTVSFTGNYSRPVDTLVDAWSMPYSSNVTVTHHEDHFIGGPNDGKVTTTEDKQDVTDALADTKYVAYKALGLSEQHELRVSVAGPQPVTLPDTIFGGTLPRRESAYSREFVEIGEVDCGLLSMDYRLKGMAPRDRNTRLDGIQDYIWVPGPDIYTEDGPPYGQATIHTSVGGYHPMGREALLGTPGHDTDVEQTLWHVRASAFLDYYYEAYAEYVAIDASWTGSESGIPVRGEPDGLGGHVLGELYMNTREINDRVFYAVQLERVSAGLTELQQDIFINVIRFGPHIAVQRYAREFDINGRLEFPGITPFPQIEEVPFLVPTDLPELENDGIYPEFFPAWEEGEEYPEIEGWSLSGGVVGGGIFDGEFICRYPKRAAIFEVREHYEVTDSFEGSLLGQSFESERTREDGRLVANEFQAHMLPTNVGVFSIGNDPPTTAKTDDRVSEAANTYDRDPYLRYAYTARDWHCDTMAWRRDAGRTGSWSIEDRPLQRFANNYERAVLHETADRVEASHTLFRAGGTAVMTFPDLLSFYPLRALHGALTVTGKIVNVAAPYLQHDLLYLDRRFPELDDCDSIGIPATGGLGNDYNLDAGDTFFFDTECLPRRSWMPGGPYRDGWTPNRPQLLVGYWGRDVNGGDRDPLFPVPGYWIPNPEEDPPEGQEYIHVPHITEAAETNFNLVRPEFGFAPDFTDGMFLASPRGAQFYELQARNFLGDIGASFDVLYVDNRTGGFITQVKWGGNGGRICETYIGNRTGAVPFRPILDAWLARGGGAPADGTKVVIVRPSVVPGDDGLPPAPGSLNPQAVSLL
ncbi:MAG: hypothetical protein RJA36_1073 [Pseudomonadota bacterium]|jgi:hypothetical protein